MKILFCIPTLYLHETVFSLYTATKKIYCGELNAETDKRVQLFSIKSENKEIGKSVK